jgi:hypothetical protein
MATLTPSMGQTMRTAAPDDCSALPLDIRPRPKSPYLRILIHCHNLLPPFTKKRNPSNACNSRLQTYYSTFSFVCWQHPMYMMASIVYLVFGLALTSMCINVVQVRLSTVTSFSYYNQTILICVVNINEPRLQQRPLVTGNVRHAR